jgi:hypothetical protein
MDHCDASLKVRCASCSGWHITTFRSGERKPRNKVPYVRLRLRLRDLVE